MKLAVNIGNTNIAVGYYENNGLIVKRYSHDDFNFTEQNITKIEIASVVPSLTDKVFDKLKNATGVEPKILSIADLDIDYSAYDSALLGIDRLLVCIGAIKKYQHSLIVFDLGTAITVNVVDKNKKFLGGAILAGLDMSLKALTAGTALLPLGGLNPPDNIIGKNTLEALASGSLYGTASMIEGMSKKIAESTKQDFKIVLTGGGAKHILPFLSFCNYIYEKELLLEGML